MADHTDSAAPPGLDAPGLDGPGHGGSATFDRRGFLRLGGFTVTAAAVLAACGSDEGAGPEGITEAGTSPALAAPPSGIVTDSTLLRTATSLHYNAMDVVDEVLALGVVSAEMASVAEAYRLLLDEQAATLAEATGSIGGTPFEERNPTVDARIVQPAVTLLGASQTVAGDAERLLHATASLATSTHQAIVPMLSQPALRAAAMQIGSVHARVTSVMARVISPANTVTTEDFAVAAPAEAAAADTTTTVETGLPSTADAAPTTAGGATGPVDIPVFQVPSAFGGLAPIQIVLGDATKFDGPTKRTIVNIETPSLNSLIYDDA
jgi:hypothetical protein